MSLADAEIFRHLQRRTADTADYRRTVAAGEWILDLAGAVRAVKQVGVVTVRRPARGLSHEFPRLYHRLAGRGASVFSPRRHGAHGGKNRKIKKTPCPLCLRGESK